MSAIKLRLKAPMQSWAGPSAWDDRLTSDGIPTRSGLIGMIACACGLNKEEDIQTLAEGLEFYVRPSSSGFYDDFQTARPYHSRYVSVPPQWDTAAKGHKTAPIIRWKKYITDGDFTVYVVSDNDNKLEKINEKLENPVWVYYLGRHCCVPSVKVPQGKYELSTEEMNQCIHLY